MGTLKRFRFNGAHTGRRRPICRDRSPFDSIPLSSLLQYPKNWNLSWGKSSKQIAQMANTAAVASTFLIPHPRPQPQPHRPPSWYKIYAQASFTAGHRILTKNWTKNKFLVPCRNQPAKAAAEIDRRFQRTWGVGEHGGQQDAPNWATAAQWDKCNGNVKIKPIKF